MEKGNKYWLSEKRRRDIFCEVGTNHMEHYVDEYQQINSWFRILDRDRIEIQSKLQNKETRLGKM